MNLATILFAIASVLFGITLCVNVAPANDLFWQLRTGHEILINHAVPHSDTYSFRRFGEPWVVHEWLTFVFYWMAYQACGYGGVWVLEASLAAAISIVVFCVIYKESGRAPLTTVALATFVQVIGSPFYQPRPQLATYLFATAVVGTCLSARRRAPKRIYLLMPVFALWANLHAGVLIGVGLLGVFALCDFIEVRWRKTLSETDRTSRSKSWRHFAAATGISMLLTLATPYSWHIYQNFGATITNATAMNTVGEWLSPDFHEGLGKLLEAFLLLLLGSLCASRKQKSLAEIVLYLGLAHEALLANRNIPLLAFIAGPLIAGHLQDAVRRLIGQGNNPDFWKSDSLFARRVPLIPVVAVVVALFCIATGRPLTIMREPDSIPSHGLERLGRLCYAVASFPEGAVAFIKREPFPKDIKMFNIYGDGGFLIWTLPEHKVFIDGRADVYFGKSLEDFATLNGMPFKWQSTLDQYAVNVIITNTHERQSKLFLSSPNWAAVYVDRAALDEKDAKSDNSIVLVRRSKFTLGFIARCRKDSPAFQDARLSQYSDYTALH